MNCISLTTIAITIRNNFSDIIMDIAPTLLQVLKVVILSKLPKSSIMHFVMSLFLIKTSNICISMVYSAYRLYDVY